MKNVEEMAREREKPLKHLLHGFAGGLISGLAAQPFQVIKTAFQVAPVNQCQNSNQFRKDKKPSIIELTKYINKTEGIKGFYRGLLPSCIKSAVSAGLFFYFLNIFRKFLAPFIKTKGTIDFTGATLTRILQTILINPILIVKTRLEVVGFNEYNNMFDAFCRIFKNEGFASFFTNGVKVSLLKDVPFSALQFPIYEKIKHILLNYGRKLSVDLKKGYNRSFIYAMSSLCATFVSCVVTNPLDVIRTRIVFQHHNKDMHQHYNSIFDAFVKLIKYDGVKGFFFGLQSRFIKKTVSAIVAWTIYEMLMDSIHNMHIQFLTHFICLENTMKIVLINNNE